MKSWLRSRSKRIGAFSAAAAVIIASLTVLTAQPAAAGSCGWQTDLQFNGDVGQVDNCPDNGADSWGWVYNGSNDGKGAALEYTLYNGLFGYIGAENFGGSATSSFWRASPGGWDIWRVRLVKYQGNVITDYGTYKFMS